MNKKLETELSTLEKMIVLYCKGRKHMAAGICPECREILEYSKERTRRCVYKENKPTCRKCPVHCYEKSRRERIREIMKYAGPRMLLRHPGPAIRHLIRELTSPGNPHVRQTVASPVRRRLPSED